MAYGEAWTELPDGPVEDQIDTLRRRTDSLRESISYVRTHHGELIRTVRQHLDESNTEHREAITALQKLHDEREVRDAQIDAGGLPLIGLGILLLGLPEQAVRQWLVWIALLALTTVMLTLTVWRRSRQTVSS